MNKNIEIILKFRKYLLAKIETFLIHCIIKVFILI